MTIKHYQIVESDLNNKSFESGSVYYCTDTRRVYIDPIDGNERILTNGDPIILTNESQREDILAPIPDKVYIVLDSLKIYIYTNGVWNNFVKDGYTPIKGTDYWTEDDKAEIKSYVNEAILRGAW